MKQNPLFVAVIIFIILHTEVENYNDAQRIARVQQNVRKLCPNEYEESITHSHCTLKWTGNVMFGRNPP